MAFYGFSRIIWILRLNIEKTKTLKAFLNSEKYCKEFQCQQESWVTRSESKCLKFPNWKADKPICESS